MIIIDFKVFFALRYIKIISFKIIYYISTTKLSKILKNNIKLKKFKFS